MEILEDAALFVPDTSVQVGRGKGGAVVVVMQTYVLRITE